MLIVFNYYLLNWLYPASCYTSVQHHSVNLQQNGTSPSKTIKKKIHFLNVFAYDMSHHTFCTILLFLSITHRCTAEFLNPWNKKWLHSTYNPFQASIPVLIFSFKSNFPNFTPVLRYNKKEYGLEKPGKNDGSVKCLTNPAT